MQSQMPLVADHMDVLYPMILNHVLDYGDEVSPRGQLTREVRPLAFTLTNPLNRFVTLPERKANYAFALIEALQFIGGTTSGAQQIRYNSNIKNWVDPESGQIEAAYGSLTCDQVPGVVDMLTVDPDSRQAILSIYHGSEHQRPMLNVPCTCTLQFFIRDDKLELITYMRSSDLWWGIPYDVFQFTVMQEMIALALGKKMGPYTHVAGSGHVYEPFFEKAGKVVSAHNESISDLHVFDLHIAPNLPSQEPFLPVKRPDNVYVTRYQARAVLLEETQVFGTSDERVRAYPLWRSSDPLSNILQEPFNRHYAYLRSYQLIKLAKENSQWKMTSEYAP